MRWSRTLIPTLREPPADAVASSYALMARAGMVRRQGSAFAWLPLGRRVLAKVERIAREELTAIGAVEVLAPQPSLESVLSLARDEIRSYKQLPLTFFHAGAAPRDDVSPGRGVLGGREALVAEAYRLDPSDESPDAACQTFREACARALHRCGLAYEIVEADEPVCHAQGANRPLCAPPLSWAFLGDSEVGDVGFVRCCACGYRATLARAEVAPTPSARGGGLLPRQDVDTPGKTTIEEVSAFLNVPPARMIKTLIYVTDAGEPVAALVRGDHTAGACKLARALGAERVALADETTIVRVTGAPVGFAGPHGLKIRAAADYAVMGILNGVTGGNQKDVHALNVTPGRDFQPEIVADVRAAAPGDACARCGGDLAFRRGIEVARVTGFGARPAAAMDATYLNSDGRARPFSTIRLSVALSAVPAARVEQRHDANGTLWPASIAPYEVAVLPLNVADQAVREGGDRVYAALLDAGVDALLDDRDARAGVKFKDADLIGVPLRVVVGRSYAESAQVEIQRRVEGTKEPAPVADVVKTVKDMLGGL